MKSGKKSAILVLVAVMMMILGFVAWQNRVEIGDTFAAMAYQPTGELLTLQEKLGLSEKGEKIFKASAPSLESRDDFNVHCKSRDQGVSVLGCYTGGKIYIYNINNEDLNGVKESTAAHELLHAVWLRMEGAEKEEVSKALLEIYNNTKYHDLLSEDLSTYAEDEQIDELHSRVGTEIANLPEALEKHYAKYFNNQDLIVDFYNSYIEPFKTLEEEMASLSAEMEGLDAEIATREAEYYKRAEELANKIEIFNNCADTAGCFRMQDVFNSTRENLMQEQAALEDYYNELNTFVERYNALVAEYNENVIRGQVLEKAINSNAKEKEIMSR